MINLFKKLRAIKNIEEILGVIGAAYFIILVILGLFLAKFLVTSFADSIQPKGEKQPLPQTFNLDAVKSLNP